MPTPGNAAPAKPMYGGQAVIEGVMMRGPHHFAVAARRAGGEIALTCEAVPKILRPAWQKWPLLRGAFAIVDAMALGTRALFWAAKVAEEDTRPAPSGEAAAPPSKVTDIALGSALVLGLLLAIGLFKVLPNLVTGAVQALTGWRGFLLGLVDLGIRFTIFFGYIGIVSRQRYVFRVFQYHGAEHKAINALEARGPLTVEAARAASRLHPRCGTSFLVVVLILSVLAVAPFYDRPVWMRILIQLAMLFPVAGISFELLRLSGKYRQNPVAAALARPGMWTQLVTTREPDDEQIEVALASLKAVLAAEQPVDEPATEEETLSLAAGALS